MEAVAHAVADRVDPLVMAEPQATSGSESESSEPIHADPRTATSRRS